MTKLKPYPFQEADIRKLVANGGTGLLVSAPGAGKTLVAVETALRTKASVVLVIAPQGTHSSAWQRTLSRQTTPSSTSPKATGKQSAKPGSSSTKSSLSLKLLDGSTRGKANFAALMWKEPGWYICTPQWFARNISKWHGVKPDLAIFDEIHMAGAWQNATRKAMYALEAEHRLGMSGTPFRNKFENSFAIVNWVFPGITDEQDYWVWRISYCLTKYDRFAPQNRIVLGERHPGELVSSLPCYIIHLQREKCCEFHPKGFLEGLDEPDVVERLLPMTTDQRKFYRQMEQSQVAWLETPDETGKLPVVAELPITARGMLRFCALGLPSYDPETEKVYFEMNCPSPKLDQLLKDVDELDGGRVLVLTHSKQFAKVAVQRLLDAGVAVEGWHGDSTKKARDITLKRFMDDEIQVIVGVIAAMGTGTDGLQEATNTVIFLSVDDDPTGMVQAYGRLDRLGQRHKVVMIYYYSEGTYDVGILSKQMQQILARNAELRTA